MSVFLLFAAHLQAFRDGGSSPNDEYCISVFATHRCALKNKQVLSNLVDH